METLEAVVEAIHQVAQEERPDGRRPLVCVACGTKELCEGPDDGCPGRVMRSILGQPEPVGTVLLSRALHLLPVQDLDEHLAEHPEDDLYVVAAGMHRTNILAAALASRGCGDRLCELLGGLMVSLEGGGAKVSDGGLHHLGAYDDPVDAIDAARALFAERASLPPPVYVLALDGETTRREAVEELREGGAVIVTDSALDEAERACLVAVGIDNAAQWMREQQGRRLVFVDTVPGETWQWQLDGEGFWACAEFALGDAERKLLGMVAGRAAKGGAR